MAWPKSVASFRREHAAAHKQDWIARGTPETEYDLRLALWWFDHGERYGRLPNDDDMERVITLTPFDGAYGPAGAVLTVNGSPPPHIVLVCGGIYHRNITAIVSIANGTMVRELHGYHRTGVEAELVRAVSAYLFGADVTQCPT
jgi:hypothetical protein